MNRWEQAPLEGQGATPVNRWEQAPLADDAESQQPPEYSAIPEQEGEGLFPWLKMQNERATIGLGKGLKNVLWDAPRQAYAHTFGTPEESAAYDAELREEERLFNPLRDESVPAHVAEIGGSAVGALAVPGPGPKANLVKRLAGYATQGAVGGATQPVLTEDGNFATDKAKQAGMGATVGAAVGGTLSGATNLVTGRIPSNTVARIGNAVHKRAMDKPLGQEGARLVDATGMDLTPAMQSGSKGMQLAENAARQSFFTADKVAEVDVKLGEQAISRVHKLMDKIKKGGGDAETVGQEVITGIKDAHTKVRGIRDFYAGKDYGKVRDLAGDKPFFTFGNLIKEAQTVADEYANIAGADPQKVRAGAEHIIKQLMGGKAAPRGVTIDQAMKQRSALSKATTGEPFPGCTGRRAARHRRTASQGGRGRFRGQRRRGRRRAKRSPQAGQ